MLARGRLLLVATIGVFAVAATSAPAHAGEVVVVDAAGAERTHDPFTPSAAEIDLGPAPGRPRILAQASSHGPRAVTGALRHAARSGAITAARHSGYRRIYRRGRSTLRRLRGARRAELSYVIRTLERTAIGRRLTPSRMPAMFLGLRRNTSYWASKPFPAAGDQVAFRGSELLFQYFPGRGLQLHPLANFKKANNLHGACSRGRPGRPVCGARPPGPRAGTPCRPGRLRRLLDELLRLGVRRGGNFVAWEYMFHFGGGSPPWMSGMAQAVAISALGRASRFLNRPDFDVAAKSALGAFEARRPVGVRTEGPLGGVHYLQYSFAPRLFIFNAFFQSLIGLHDYGKLTDDPRAKQLFREAEPEAQREVPRSDVGDWTRYSFRGRESTPEYHELLREVLQGLGRRLGGAYCTYATKYRGYQTQPPRVQVSGPAEARARRLVRVRFTLSKLSVVEVRIFKRGRLAMRRLATLRRGTRSVPWRPRSPGRYTVRVGAKELRTGRSLRGRASAAIMVRRAP